MASTYLTILLVSIGFLVGCSGESQKPVQTDGDDPKWQAAIRSARDTVGDFIKELENQDPKNRYLLKIKVVDGEEIEHLWTSGVNYENGNFSGTIVNEPYKIFFRSDWDKNRMGVCPEPVADRLNRSKIVGADPIHFVDKSNARDMLLGHLTPDCL